MNESQLLTAVKHHALVFNAVWAGFRRSVEAFWAGEGAKVLSQFTAFTNVSGHHLVRQLTFWKNRLVGMAEPSAGIPAPNLAEVIRRWQEQVDPSLPDPAVQAKVVEARRAEFNELKADVGKFGRAVFDRARLFESMLQTPEMGET